MFIPLGTDRPLKRVTKVNHALIGANILVFCVQLLLRRFGQDSYELAMGWAVLDPQDFHIWGLFSYAFLHNPTSILHILGNMVLLWVFGPNVEDRLGRWWYLAFYLGGAAAAGGLHLAVSDSGVVGASGAISAVCGAYLVLFPRTHIKTLFILIIIGVFSIPAVWFIGAGIAWNLMFVQAQDRVARGAHLGGYAYGMGISFVLLWTRLLPREVYDLFSIGRQAARRRQFKEVMRKADSAGPRRDPKKEEKPDPVSDAMMAARAVVSVKIADEDMDGAAAAYTDLLDRYGKSHPATLLSRRQQYEIGNHFFRAGDHQNAAVAYERFVDGYPTDSEAPSVLLLLGVINARYLNDPTRAKELITKAIEGLAGEDELSHARELLKELG